VDLLQPPSQKGQSEDLAIWLSLQEIETIAFTAAQKYTPTKPNAISRMDVRPNKGIVKVLFEEENLEVQIDGTSGKILSVAPRHADWIESIHDGSIISDLFKLVSMNVLGWGVIIMILSGVWLWYGPRRLRKRRKKRT